MSEFENGIAWMIAGGLRGEQPRAAAVPARSRKRAVVRLLWTAVERLARARRSPSDRRAAYRPL